MVLSTFKQVGEKWVDAFVRTQVTPDRGIPWTLDETYQRTIFLVGELGCFKVARSMLGAYLTRHPESRDMWYRLYCYFLFDEKRTEALKALKYAVYQASEPPDSVHDLPLFAAINLTLNVSDSIKDYSEVEKDPIKLLKDLDVIEVKNGTQAT